jgi:DNA-binding response OmpR family regulator
MLSKPSILLVEDDPRIAGTLSLTLKSSYDLQLAENGKKALLGFQNHSFSLIILDLHLPDMNGLDICQQIRQTDLQTPILILSGAGQTLTKIKLLDSGANDYLTKPFVLGELQARIRALLRDRKLSAKQELSLHIGNVYLDRRSYSVVRSGLAILLRPKEFSILEYLMTHAGKVVSREELVNAIWSDGKQLWTNSLDVHVKHLRDSLDKPFANKLIHTIHGIGYSFEYNPERKRSGDEPVFNLA